MIVLLTGFASVYCQTSTRSDYVWVSIGGGFFDGNYSNGLCRYGSIDWSMKKVVETASGSKHRNNTLRFRGIKYSEMVGEDYNGSLNDFGLLYGKTFGNVFQFSILAGIGVLGGWDRVIIPHGPTTPPTYLDKRYSTLNIPLELGIGLIPSKYVGISLGGFANFNSKKSMIGLNLKLEFGKIR